MIKTQRRFLLFLCLILCSFFTFGQVTTSTITGIVKDSKGQFLSNATISAIHEPSGTRYVTISKTGGVFTLAGLRSGGPYKVTIEYVGYKNQVFDGITLLLGDTYNVNATMSENAVDLSTVTVRGTKRINQDRTGATTNIGAYQLATLPTVTRSITDFTRLTPPSQWHQLCRPGQPHEQRNGGWRQPEQ